MKSKNSLVFMRHYLNAVINGAQPGLMKRRYPDWDLEWGENYVKLVKINNKKQLGITEKGEAVSQKVDMTVSQNDPEQEARRIADAAKNSVPKTLMKVD